MSAFTRRQVVAVCRSSTCLRYGCETQAYLRVCPLCGRPLLRRRFR